MGRVSGRIRAQTKAEAADWEPERRRRRARLGSRGRPSSGRPPVPLQKFFTSTILVQIVSITMDSNCDLDLILGRKDNQRMLVGHLRGEDAARVWEVTVVGAVAGCHVHSERTWHIQQEREHCTYETVKARFWPRPLRNSHVPCWLDSG